MMNETLYNKILTITETFSEEARRADRENSFPTENFQALKDNDLLSLIIPSEFGGHGVNFADYQSYVSAIGKQCASTASAFNMHNIILGALADIPFNTLDDKQKKTVIPFVERLFGEVTQHKKVFASATSEPGIGARYSKTKTNYKKVDGGYIINGEKAFVTMANYADYYSIIANKYNADGSASPSHYLSFFLVPRGLSGITIQKDWDTLGMRATQSHRVIFHDVFIPNDCVFLGVTGFALMKVIRAPHWIIGGYLGVYLGIIQAAYEICLQYISNRTDLNKLTGLGMEPLIQSRLAEIYGLYQQAHQAVSYASNLILNGNDLGEAHRALYHAKYVVGEAVMEITAKSLKLCGATMIHKKFDLERLFRDSRCGALMPATSDVCQLYVGRSLLGLPIDNLW